MPDFVEMPDYAADVLDEDEDDFTEIEWKLLCKLILDRQADLSKGLTPYGVEVLDEIIRKLAHRVLGVWGNSYHCCIDVLCDVSHTAIAQKWRKIVLLTIDETAPNTSIRD